MRFGQALRAVRQAKDISQERLARKLHVAQQAVSRYEKGERACPPEVAALAAKALVCAGLLGVYCSQCPLFQNAQGLVK